VNYACTAHFGPLRLTPDATPADIDAITAIETFFVSNQLDYSCDSFPRHMLATSVFDGIDSANGEQPLYLTDVLFDFVIPKDAKALRKVDLFQEVYIPGIAFSKCELSLGLCLTPMGGCGLIKAEAARRYTTAKTVAKWVEPFGAEGVDDLRGRSLRPLPATGQSNRGRGDRAPSADNN